MSAMPSDSGPVLGAVDIGATKTLVAIVGVETAAFSPGSPWLSPPRRLPTDHDPERHVAAVAATLAAMAGTRRLWAVGVAVPGPLDPVEGVVLRSPNLPWDRFPLGARLGRSAGVPVALEDDANAGALGEALLGAGSGRDPVLYLTLSTGVGAGVVTGGRLVRGAHQAAGEIGHLVVDPTGPRCGCGGRGHVEAYVGGASLGRRARAAWPGARLADGSPAPRDAAAIFRLARRGDPAAAAIVDEAAAALALALAAAAAVLDPGVIVVGGSLARAQRGLVRRAAAQARGMVIGEAGRALAVVPAALGDWSPLAGAALAAGRLVLEPADAPGAP